MEALLENKNVIWFDFEEDKVYSKRKSEWVQQYLQKKDKMPGGGEKDDLF